MSSKSGNFKLSGNRWAKSKYIPFYVYNLFFLHKYDFSPLARTLKALLAFIGATLSIALFAVAVISTTSAIYSPLAIGFFISAYAAVILSIVHSSLSRKANYRFISSDEGESGGFFAPLKMLFCKAHGCIKVALFWLILLMSGTVVNAQSFTLNGRLIDGVDSIPLAGFNVEIKIRGPPGTSYYRTTDANGYFVFTTDIKDEYTSDATDAAVTSISSRPYFTIQNNSEREANIIIYDILGREVRKINAPLVAGINNIQWNARNEHNEPVSDGTYITRIKIGNEIFDKKFIIIKGNTEGTPQQYIRREIKKIEKTTADYTLNIKTYEEKGYEKTMTLLQLEGSTPFHITLPKKELIENTFPSNGEEIKTLSNLLNHYKISTVPQEKPKYPIQINTTGLQANIKTAITNIANEINNKTGKNIIKLTTTPNTNSSTLECIIVNDDTTSPIKTNNIYAEWTKNDTITTYDETVYIPKEGKIYINNGHQLTTEELHGYLRKALQKAILNTQKETYNKQNNSYPKGLQELSNDEIKLLKFYFNNKRHLRDFRTFYTQTITLTDKINIIGTITIPDTTSWQEKPVVREIIKINGESDTTNKEGKYAFTNTNKGLKGIIIDSIKTDGTVVYHQYEEGTNITQDTTRTEVMFPKIKLDHTFYGLTTILEYFAYNMGVTSPTGNEFYRKPIYPVQVYIDQSIPTNWKPYMTNAINDWNTLSHTKLFEIVNTPYTEWDKTAVTIVGVNMGSGGNDGECEVGEHINDRPLRYYIKLNTGSTMNGTTNIYQVTGHEFLRVIYRGGQPIMSENNKHIGFWARTLLPQIAPKDEGIQAFILHKLPHKVRVNNYKGLGGK